MLILSLKVKHAAECGAIGVILFSNVDDVTGADRAASGVHPNSWFLPGDVAQDGSVLPEIQGDPLSPGLPSLELMYRLKPEQANLPTIPSHPIGWGQAQQLMTYAAHCIIN